MMRVGFLLLQLVFQTRNALRKRRIHRCPVFCHFCSSLVQQTNRLLQFRPQALQLKKVWDRDLLAPRQRGQHTDQQEKQFHISIENIVECFCDCVWKLWFENHKSFNQNDKYLLILLTFSLLRLTSGLSILIP